MDNTFVAIDFETAVGYYACSVGIVTVCNQQIIDEYHTLIRPPNNVYNWYNIQVHGIKPEDTEDASDFEGVYNEIKKRLSEKTIVAHNESFDRNVLSKNMLLYDIAYSDLNIANRWECTVKIYKSLGYKPARLDACCQVHGIPLNHHDALSDARACAELYLLARNGMN